MSNPITISARAIHQAPVAGYLERYVLGITVPSGSYGITTPPAMSLDEARAVVNLLAAAPALLAALRAILPYAESRFEDIEEEHGRIEALSDTDRAYSPEVVAQSLADLDRARARFETARAALALADGDAPAPAAPQSASPALAALRILAEQCESMEKGAEMYRGWFAKAGHIARCGLNGKEIV